MCILFMSGVWVSYSPPEVPLVFKPSKGTLPGVRPKDWDVQYVVQSVSSTGKHSL